MSIYAFVVQTHKQQQHPRRQLGGLVRAHACKVAKNSTWNLTNFFPSFETCDSDLI